MASTVPLLLKEAISTSITVNTGNFSSFLIGADMFPYKTWDFAPQLDLSSLRPAVQALYENSRDVYQLPDEYRASMGQMYKEMAKVGITVDSHYLDTKAPGERSSVVYFDLNDSTSKITPPVHGEFDKGRVATFDVLGAGHLPLLEKHTHPVDYLPTVEDYTRLLFDIIPGERRLVNGIMVLTPKMQTLALPTADTPRFANLEEVAAFVSDVQGGIEKKLHDWNTKHGQRMGDFHIRLNERIAQRVRGILEKERSGEFSQEEKEKAVAELHDDVKYWSQRVSRSIDVGFRKRIEHIDNAERVQFARDIEVQLYFSTDMTHFKKFTA